MYTTYHITDIDTFNANVGLFREAHWVPCGDKIVCACMCLDDEHRATWEAVPTVTSLPDPLRNKVIDANCATQLAGYGVTITDTTFDVADKLNAHSPAFKFDFR